MKRICLLVIIIVNCSYAQLKIRTGHLAAFDFKKGNIVSTDTSLKWEMRTIGDSTITERYDDHFTYQERDYFVHRRYVASPHIEYEETYIINSAGKKVGLVNNHLGYIDLLGTYFFETPRITNIGSGVWLSDGVEGISFFNSTAPVVKVSPNAAACISGKIKESYLLSKLHQRNKYYLVDLSHSPEIIIKDSLNLVSLMNLYSLSRVVELTNDYYLLQLYTSVCLAKLSGKQIIVEGILIDNTKEFYYDYPGWSNKDLTLYFIKKDKFVKAIVDYDLKALKDTTILIEGINRWFDFSEDSKTFAAIKSNTLIVYSVAADSIITTHNLNSSNVMEYKPVVTNERVYYHVLDKTTEIEKGNIVPTEFILEQNYPNPFNPTTTINYSIPVGNFPSREGNGRGVSVTLKVFDLLGREVTTLVNEEKPPGNYFIQFDGSSLPSGIYFYRLQACNPSSGSGQAYSETKKMILLK